MSGRRDLILGNSEYYHVYNRSVGSIDVFRKESDIKHFLELISFYRFNQNLRFSFYDRLNIEAKKSYAKKYLNSTPLVELYAYCLIPNHFHILVKQISDNGIRIYLSNLQNGFAKYFNVKNKRFGSVFQRPFKAKHVETDEMLLHISRYIHLNPISSFTMSIETLKTSNTTSFPYYLQGNNTVINTNFIVKLIGSSDKYEKFVEDRVDYQRKLEMIKGLTLE